MKPREFMTFGALFFSFPQFTALFRKGFILTGMRMVEKMFMKMLAIKKGTS